MVHSNKLRWTAAAAGATACLFGLMGVGVGLAGAAQSVDPLQNATGEAGAAAPSAAPIVTGTYKFINNGVNIGTITFASANTFTASFDGDSGTWVQDAKNVGLVFSGGSDAAGGCVFAGKANTTGTGIGNATAPGHWACPEFGTTGSFYIKAGHTAATQARSDAFARSGAVAATAGPIVPGSYTWTEDGFYSGSIAIASGNTYTSTLSGNDSGTWVQSGKTFSLSITGGVDSGIGCLEVGPVNSTGTAVGTTAKPGKWACPGTGTTGTFVIS